MSTYQLNYYENYGIIMVITGIGVLFLFHTNCHELNMNYPKILIHEKFVFNLWTFVFKEIVFGKRIDIINVIVP